MSEPGAPSQRHPQRHPPDEVFGRGLYAIVDLAALADRDPCRFASAVLDRGAVAVQLRAKLVSAGRILEIGRTLSRMCRERGVPLIINDRADIAVACGAQGVHLGQDDLAIEDARPLLAGTSVRLIGVSTHDLSQARRAVDAGADYLGYGPVFCSSTKAPAGPAVGVEGVARCVAIAGRPVVAIGGIEPQSATALAAAGARAVAVIGALARAADPGRVAEQFREAFL